MIINRVVLAAILLALSPISAVAADSCLVKNGKAAGCIVLPQDETNKAVVTAANNLASYLKTMTGADVPVLRDNEQSTGFRLLIGSTRFAPVKPSDVTEAKVGFDGFIIKSVPNGLLLAGRIPKGTEYAVYHFAEELLGIHWFSPEDDGPTIPARSNVQIPKLNLTVKPDFAWRGHYWSFQGLPMHQNKETPLSKVLNTNRDKWWDFNRLWGINAEVGHAFIALVPKELYAEHPEYFTYLNYTFKHNIWAPFGSEVVPADAQGNMPKWPWKTGRHDGGGDATQRCFSNPDVLEMVAGKLSKQFDADPTLRFASLSANDGPWWCNCDDCLAMGPTRSHQALEFANRVAKANKAKHPDRGYFMNAYMATIEPPVGMKAEKGIVPIIAPLWNCAIHPISSTCPDSVYMRRVYTEWSKITNGHIGCRPYTTPGPFTFPGPVALTEMMQYVHKRGAMGFMRENQFTPKVNWAMMNWLETKLMWNVNRDAAKMRRLFIEGYYGKKAAEPIERIYKAIEKGAADSVTGIASSAENGNGLHEWKDGYEPLRSTIEKCQPDIDKALAIAQNEQEKFKYRITRDIKTLTGEEQSEF